MYKRVIFPILFLFCGVAKASSPLSDLFVVPEVSRYDAPEFKIDNLQGDSISLSDYQGKIVLLNFWATWCMPCRAEMPSMESLWQKYQDQGFVVIAVSNNDGSRKQVETFSKLLDLSFLILLDTDGKVSDLYKVSNMPTSFLIDRSGKVISRIVGSDDWASVEAVQLVEDILAE